MIEGDIRKVSPKSIRDIDLGGRDLDVLVVCAPCQPFSSQNRKRGSDQRSTLILEAGRFARILRPKVVFFENVPGLAGHSELLKKLKRGLGREYTLSAPERIDAADFGVPQRRVRCIMVATRGVKPPSMPPPITPKGRRTTVRQAIGHLPPLKAGEKHKSDILHSARHHKEIALRRLAAVPKDGGSRSSLPADLALSCHATIGSSQFSDVYGRMSWNDVAPTLTTGCTDITRGRFAHPRDDRAITAREAALLQTFPQSYQFLGSSSEVQVQIGNAVPVKLVEALAPMFRQAISEASI